MTELGVPPLASLYIWGSKDCCIRFECPNDKIELVAEHLFKEYNRRISKLNSIEDKVSCIADFCQMLEWLHGFPDGQTRTDMLLLIKELCRHGSNPPILNETHIPHYSTKSEWLSYLQVGIKKWAEVAAEIC